jgi:hypothetical protein
MNTFQLNSNQLGNGSASPNTFWSATTLVLVSALASFEALIGIASTAEVSSVANFTRYVGMLANQTVSVSSNAVLSRILAMRATTSVLVTSVAITLVGRLRQMAANPIVLVSSPVIRFTILRAMRAVMTALVSSVGRYGYNRTIESDVSNTVTTTANFSNFGEYATDDRQILVDSQDRTIEVI